MPQARLQTDMACNSNSNRAAIRWDAKKGTDGHPRGRLKEIQLMHYIQFSVDELCMLLRVTCGSVSSLQPEAVHNTIVPCFLVFSLVCSSATQV